MSISKTLRLHHTYKRLIIAAIIGVLAAFIAMYFGLSRLAILIAWDIAILIYVIWVWLTIWGMNPTQTKSHAVREDPGRAAADVLLLVASIVSLVAVISLILKAGSTTGEVKSLDISIGLVSIVLSWLLVHTTYTLKYARLFYNEPGGEVEFHENDLPQYTDFAYLAFTLGMTFQVSDTNLKTKEIRKTALKHALLSFLFSTIIIASTINAMVSLSK